MIALGSETSPKVVICYNGEVYAVRRDDFEGWVNGLQEDNHSTATHHEGDLGDALSDVHLHGG